MTTEEFTALAEKNTFQWAFCWNINYEHLEAILWNECRLSRYEKYEFALLERPWFATEKVKNETIKMETENSLENQLSNSQGKNNMIQECKQSLLELLLSRRSTED